ncbi:MAG: hypothetical protein K2Z80_31160 [Xanthobacteraceae bacterium]|nr:hypothetical protein [Xanthobacteraceae bacterium]
MPLVNAAIFGLHDAKIAELCLHFALYVDAQYSTNKEHLGQIVMTKQSGFPKLVGAGAMVAAFALVTLAEPAWAIVPAPASSLRASSAPSMVTKIVHACRYGYPGYSGCRPYGYLPFYHHHHHWAYYGHHWAHHGHFGGFGHGGFSHGGLGHGGFGHGGFGHGGFGHGGGHGHHG